MSRSAEPARSTIEPAVRPAGGGRDTREGKDLEPDELHRLRAREAVLDFLSGWSSRLHLATDKADVARLAAEAVHQTTPYRQSWIYIMPQDPERTEMELVMFQGPHADLVVHRVSMLPTEGDAYLQEILTSSEPVICVDARTDPRVNRDIVDMLGNRTIVNVPLRLLDRRVGALGVGTFGDEGVAPPTPHALWALSLVGQQLAVAVSRYQLEEERARARQEREHLQAQFLQAQKLESLGLLAGGVAHDFNNLMVGVLGNASLARDVLDADGPAEPLLAAIEIAAQRASDLANQMLSYAGRASYAMAPVGVAPLLEEMRALLNEVIPRTVMNLVTNAAQAIAPGAPGRIDLTVEDGRHAGRPAVVLRVADDGCGMTPEVQACLFDPFFTTKPHGHGLGMAAVLGIVRAHGGEVRVASTPGEGSEFQIVLPAVPGVIAGRAEGPPSAAALPRTGGRVLVMDDEELVRTFARRLLTRIGLDVILASDGEAGLAELSAGQQPWSLLLMDLSMPKLSGPALYHEVRARAPDVPILLSSGRPPEWPWQAERDPRLGFIAKPYRMQELVDAMTTLMAS